MQPLSILVAVTLGVTFVGVLAWTAYYCWTQRHASGRDIRLPLKAKNMPPEGLAGLDLSLEALLNDERKVISKPLSRVPIAIDLPRLAAKTSIYNEQGVPVVEGLKFPPLGTPVLIDQQVESTKQGNAARNVFNVMVGLANELGAKEDAATIKSTFFNYVPEYQNLDVGTRLARMLESELSEDSKVVTVLKLMNQAALAPAAMRLKMAVGRAFQYKDRRGEWSIDVRVGSNDSLEITQRKREMSWGPAEESEHHFDFCWELRLELSRKDPTVIRIAEFFITEIVFHPDMPEHRKETILEVVRQIYRPRL